MLKEFIKIGYDIDQLMPYQEFLEECAKKDYTEQAIHKHHILPKFMGGSNFDENLITLSVEDHFNSHLILSKCFCLGSDEYHYNLTSANKILGSIKRYFKKNSIIYQENEFWKTANLLIKDLSRGKNNHMYGKTHTEDARSKISKAQKGLSRSEEWKANHSKKVLREKNGRYGIEFAHSNETKQKISKKLKELAKVKFPLSDGIFECCLIINSKQKNYYRYCPTCSEKIYYGGKWQATDSLNRNSECKPCSIITGSSKVKGRKYLDTSCFRKPKSNTENMGKYDKSGNNNPRSLTIMDIETNVVWYNKKSLQDELNVNYGTLCRLIETGRYKIIGKTNGSSNR